MYCLYAYFQSYHAIAVPVNLVSTGDFAGHVPSSSVAVSAAGASSLPYLLPSAIGRSSFLADLLRSNAESQAPSQLQPSSTSLIDAGAPGVSAVTPKGIAHVRHQTPSTNGSRLPLSLQPQSAAESLTRVPSLAGAAASAAPSETPIVTCAAEAHPSSSLANPAVPAAPEVLAVTSAAVPLVVPEAASLPEQRVNVQPLLQPSRAAAAACIAPSLAALDPLPSEADVDLSTALVSSTLSQPLAAPAPVSMPMAVPEVVTPHLQQSPGQNGAACSPSHAEPAAQQGADKAQVAKQVLAMSAAGASITLLPPPSCEAKAPMQQRFSDEGDDVSAEPILPVATSLPGRSAEPTRFTESLAPEAVPLQPSPKEDPAAEEKLPLSSHLTGSPAIALPTTPAAATTEGRLAAVTNGVLGTTMPLPSVPQPRVRAVHSAGRLGGLLTPLTSTVSPTTSSGFLQPISATAGGAISAAAALPAAVRSQASQLTAAASPIGQTQTTGTYCCWLRIIVAALPSACQLAVTSRLSTCVSQSWWQRPTARCVGCRCLACTEADERTQ